MRSHRPAARTPLVDGELLAAVDLGSNSFHMVVARYTLGQLRVVDRLRETVRLAEGLDGKGGLRGPALQRALDCLARFGQRVRTLPPHRVRCIATNTVRALANPQRFLVPAETALGHAIEVVAGREEARLIWIGVAHGSPPTGKRRLVMDIGGGSTEFIIGEGFDPLERESLQMGCVATTRRFFPGGKLSKKRWREGLTEISAEFQQFASAYRARGWEEVLGCSGTIKSIGEIAAAMKLGKGAITPQAVAAIRDRMLASERIEDVALPGLNDDRRPVLPGGLLVMEAAFNALGLQRIDVSKVAMREGILFDMIGRASDADPRDASIAALAERYAVDRAQAARVEGTALALFDEVEDAWDLAPEDREMLAWAARVHEIGLTIAHSGYHQHGAYVLEHSDIAGFSRQEQQALAALVRCHRRSIPLGVIGALPDRLAPVVMRLTVLLRLAVLLHRAHSDDGIGLATLKVDGRALQLRVDAAWLEAHPLTRTDLATEREELAEAGFKLLLRTA